jgi:hypothetical protein
MNKHSTSVLTVSCVLLLQENLIAFGAGTKVPRLLLGRNQEGQDGKKDQAAKCLTCSLLQNQNRVVQID